MSATVISATSPRRLCDVSSGADDNCCLGAHLLTQSIPGPSMFAVANIYRRWPVTGRTLLRTRWTRYNTAPSQQYSFNACPVTIDRQLETPELQNQPGSNTLCWSTLTRLVPRVVMSIFTPVSTSTLPSNTPSSLRPDPTAHRSRHGRTGNIDPQH